MFCHSERSEESKKDVPHLTGGFPCSRGGQKKQIVILNEVKNPKKEGKKIPVSTGMTE